MIYDNGIVGENTKGEEKKQNRGDGGGGGNNNNNNNVATEISVR